MSSLNRDELVDKKRDAAAQYAKPIQSSVESISTMDAVMSFARQMSLSTVVPLEYRGNPANCLAAVSMAIRMREEPYTVAMNLRISDKPSWYAPYMIARLNQSQIFRSRLGYRIEGEGAKMTCVAYARDSNNLLHEGPMASMAQVIAQGWANDSTSLWVTNPRQAIMYRAAVYFIRLHAPEVLHGVMSVTGCDDVTSDIQTATNSTAVEEPLTPAKPAASTVVLLRPATGAAAQGNDVSTIVASGTATDGAPGAIAMGEAPKRRRGRPTNAEVAMRKAMQQRQHEELSTADPSVDVDTGAASETTQSVSDQEPLVAPGAAPEDAANSETELEFIEDIPAAAPDAGPSEIDDVVKQMVATASAFHDPLIF